MPVSSIIELFFSEYRHKNAVNIWDVDCKKKPGKIFKSNGINKNEKKSIKQEIQYSVIAKAQNNNNNKHSYPGEYQYVS